MRIALLSDLPAASRMDGARGAYTQFAGAMVIERQLDLAVELGCERVLCLTDEVGPEIARLQVRAQKAGVAFRAFRRPGRLPDMVSGDDELVAMTPALLPDDRAAQAALDRQTILVLPAELAVPLGYERIDLEFAWAGIMLVPGRVVAGLKDLPGDVDTLSALLRIGLQNGIGMTPVDRKVLSEGQWHFDADRASLEERETCWIEAQRDEISFRAPGLAVAEQAGLRLARDVAGQSTRSVPGIAGAILLCLAVAAGALGWPASGIVLLALCALSLHLAQVVDRVARRGEEPTRLAKVNWLISLALDPAFILLLVLASPEELGILSAFGPLMLVGLLRLGEYHASAEWQKTYADRIALGFILAPFAFAGFAAQGTALLALIALGSRFVPVLRRD